MMDETEIHRQLLAAFQDEARERLEALYAGLSSLEGADRDAPPTDVLDAVFREVHSLKGAARSVNLTVVESLCQEVESIFAEIKAHRLAFSGRLFDALYAAIQLVERSIAPDADAEKASREIKNMIQSLTDAKACEPSEEKPSEKEASDRAGEEKSADEPKPDAKPLFASSVRIPTDKLDALLLKTEELIPVKQSAYQHLNRLQHLNHSIQEWRQKWERFQGDFRRFQGAKDADAAIELTTAFIDDTREFIRDIDQRMTKTATAFERNNRTFSGLLDDLLEETKKTSLMPFSSLFTVFPRMVREIAKDRGKSVDLKTSGENVEIDKRILEGIKDPLTHLLRNAVDHGIEAPEVRTSQGKPAMGTIHVAVSQPESNQVSLEISDDGEGIHIETIKTQAIEKGIISSAHAASLDEAEALNLILNSGVSSSPMITEISGRGLGMSIIKDALDHLGGRMRIRSEPGRGTAFSIKLPVTLATFRGVLIEVSGYLFILPNAQIRHSLKIRPETVKTAENQAIISFNGRPVSLVDMADVLGISKPGPNPRRSEQKTIPAVILENGATQMAFRVDAVINEQEVLVKPLGKQLKKVRHIAGATVLGTGRVVPILNIKELIVSASSHSMPSVQPSGEHPEQARRPKSVLVVEDSFTSRTLLKNILEASGYQVETAIDGTDGLSRLKSRYFDAVVSDIEMPRMDGFELTAGIRADNSLAALPVILVTSLDAAKDREKGMEAGADAYIVKSSFDQSNLIEVLDQLV